MSNPATQFKKGESGNPDGRPKKEESLTDLMREFLRKIPEGEKKTYKELFIRKCFSIAMKGDIAAMKMIWNYLEGMPLQKFGGDKDNPLFIQLSEQIAQKRDIASSTK